MPKTAAISIVDDDESVREAVLSLIKALGFVAETFSCAKDFLNSDRLLTTSCLIADVQMPGMSGPELHRHLVASGHPIPTVLITAYPDESLRARAAKAGIICCLRKPFSEEDLLRCVNQALAQGQAAGS